MSQKAFCSFLHSLSDLNPGAKWFNL